MGVHIHHKDVNNRLKRAKGHLQKVIEMIDAGEPCLKVAQHVHAVSKAIINAKQFYIKDHIDHCLSKESISNPDTLDRMIKDFKEITRYLN